MASVVALAQPLEVVSGEDLEAWRALPRQHVPDAQLIAGWQVFIERYPSSPLAEVAWQRLDQTGGLDSDWASAPELQPVLQRLERSHQAHELELQRRATQVAVADLNADGTRDVSVPSKFSLAVGAGAAFDGSNVLGTVSGRAEYGRVAVIGRSMAAQRPYASGGLRLSASMWGPWLEANLDSNGRVDAQLGGRYRLFNQYWVEGSVGGCLSDAKVMPVARVELTRTFMGKSTLVTR